MACFYIRTRKLSSNAVERQDLLKRFSYIPPEAHGRPMLFEGVLTIPSLDVIKSPLRYTEHQPDAQRGWDFPPAAFIPVSNNSLEHCIRRKIYTPAVLVDLATPDFGMSYNVIIMSSLRDRSLLAAHPCRTDECYWGRRDSGVRIIIRLSEADEYEVPLAVF